MRLGDAVSAQTLLHSSVDESDEGLWSPLKLALIKGHTRGGRGGSVVEVWWKCGGSVVEVWWKWSGFC